MNNLIMMNRGDDNEFEFTIRDSDSETGTYILKNDDAVYFGVMEPHQKFEDAVIRKKYTECDSQGIISIILKPEDTIDLEPGVYYYAIKLHQYSEADHIDIVTTVVDKTKFIIKD